MKQKNAFTQIMTLTVTLLLITAAVAAALAGVNMVTTPIIDQITAQKTADAIAAVLPGESKELESFTDETGLVQKVYASDAGYAVQVAPSGFGGTVVIMVGVDPNGKVLGIDVVSHAETAGLGDVAAAKNAKGEAFRSQYAAAEAPFAVGENVDAISGATITSKAVTTGVNAAVECVKNMG